MAETGERRVPDPRFADNLRAVREEAGVSQERLAEMVRDAGYASFTQQALSQMESGARRVEVGIAQALAEALGTNVLTLLQPPGRAREARRLINYVREVRERYRDVVRSAAYLDGALARLDDEVRRVSEGDLAEALAHELAFAARALDECGKVR